MPQVGSNAKPIMIKGKKTGKILGDTGSWYKKKIKKDMKITMMLSLEKIKLNHRHINYVNKLFRFNK